MHDADRFKLRFGPYRAPPFRYGQRVLCEVRGLVAVCGLTDASIPWPICCGIGRSSGRTSPRGVTAALLGDPLFRNHQ